MTVGADKIAGVASAAILVDYHRHSRFINDGIFSDNKIPLQYKFDHEKLPEIVSDAKEGFEIAKLAYDPKSTDRYELLHDKDGKPYRVTDSYGLDASAYRDKQTGGIIISVAGIETKHADGAGDTAMDVYSAFKSTAGAASLSMPNLVKFTQDVQNEYGNISTISGHSLGGYESMQLKVIADKQGLTTKDCKLFTYDIPGMTHSLAKELNEKYGVTEAEISSSLYNKNVTSIINDSNSFNTLGALPGNIITATDPAHSNYKEYAINHLLPKGHVLGAFDKSFAANNWFEGNNYGHARGPEYITAFAAAGAAGAFNPWGYAAAAEPVLRHAQGALGELGGEYKHLLQDKDPSVTDGLRPQNGEAPKMYAYKHLNDYYLAEMISTFKSLGGRDGADEDKLAIADKTARDPAHLEAKIDKIISDYENRGTLDKALDNTAYAAKWLTGWVTDNEEIAKLGTSQEALEYQKAIAAKQELISYKQDYEAHEKTSAPLTSEENSKNIPNLQGLSLDNVQEGTKLSCNIAESANTNQNPSVIR